MNPWRVATMLVAGVVLVLGLFAIVSPDAFVGLARYAIRPTGLYVIAALRVVFGAILALAATASRWPRFLRVVAVVVIIAGVLTPLYGVDRSRAAIDWLVSLGPLATRLVGLAITGVGGLFLYAVNPPSRPV